MFTGYKYKKKNFEQNETEPMQDRKKKNTWKRKIDQES